MDVLRQARGRSFLVSSPPGGGADEAAGLLARFWLGAGPEDQPPDLDEVRGPRMADVRRIIQEAWTKPVARDRKAVVVSLGARPSREVLNALLRLAEEPPDHLGVFLASTEVRTLPATLVSRLVPLRLRPVAEEALRRGLESRGLSPERALDIARESGGWMAVAERLAQLGPPDLLVALEKEMSEGPYAFIKVQEALGKDRKGWVGKLRGELEGRLRVTGDPRYLGATAAASRAQRDLEANLNGSLVIEKLLLELEDIGILGGGEKVWAGGQTSSSTSSNARTAHSTREPRGTSHGAS